MSQRINRTVDKIVGRAEALTTKAPAAIDALLDARRQADGAPTRLGPTIGGNADTTSPEAATITRIDHYETLITAIFDELDAAAQTLHNLERDCDRYIYANTPAVVLPPPPRCDSGINYRGWTVPRAAGGWSRPDCHNIPSEGKTCDACEMEASKWARRNPKEIRA